MLNRWSDPALRWERALPLLVVAIISAAALLPGRDMIGALAAAFG